MTKLEGFKQIGDFLGVQEETARGWVERHGLPVDLTGGTVSALRAALQDWKKRHTMEGFKQIAGFLGVKEKTARDWAEHHGLPVRMTVGTASAMRPELEDWHKQKTTSYVDHIKAKRTRRAVKAQAGEASRSLAA